MKSNYLQIGYVIDNEWCVYMSYAGVRAVARSINPTAEFQYAYISIIPDTDIPDIQATRDETDAEDRFILSFRYDEMVDNLL